jgi:hypothetical protein
MQERISMIKTAYSVLKEEMEEYQCGRSKSMFQQDFTHCKQGSH